MAINFWLTTQSRFYRFFSDSLRAAIFQAAKARAKGNRKCCKTSHNPVLIEFNVNSEFSNWFAICCSNRVRYLFIFPHGEQFMKMVFQYPLRNEPKTMKTHYPVKSFVIESSAMCSCRCSVIQSELFGKCFRTLVCAWLCGSKLSPFVRIAKSVESNKELIHHSAVWLVGNGERTAAFWVI